MLKLESPPDLDQELKATKPIIVYVMNCRGELKELDVSNNPLFIFMPDEVLDKQLVTK